MDVEADIKLVEAEVEKYVRLGLKTMEMLVVDPDTTETEKYYIDTENKTASEIIELMLLAHENKPKLN